MKNKLSSEDKTANDNVIYLCSCAVNEFLPDKNIVAKMDLDNLYRVARRHMLTAMVGMTLQKAGLSNPQFDQAVATAQKRTVIFNYELGRVSAKLEDKEIWYMPLKGAVIKNIYPTLAMREMSDYDILFDASRAADVKDIMIDLGFTVKSFGNGNHDSYIKEPITNFEMHTSLFGYEQGEKMRLYYKDVKDRLVPDDGCKYGFHFTSEDFYVYMVAHAYKHYMCRGTGLRSLIDTYVYLNKTKIDMEYVSDAADKLGFADYEKENRELSMALFKGEALSASQQQMLDYIVSCGAYGTFEHGIENMLKKEGESKSKYFLRRVWGPFRNDLYRDRFERRYATFFKYPILRPFLPFYRLINALKSNPKRIFSEAKVLIKAGKA